MTRSASRNTDGVQIVGAKQLLAFSRSQVLEVTIVNLNTVVASVETMLSRLIREDIRLVSHLAADLQGIKADPGQLEQVLMNLS